MSQSNAVQTALLLLGQKTQLQVQQLRKTKQVLILQEELNTLKEKARKAAKLLAHAANTLHLLDPHSQTKQIAMPAIADLENATNLYEAHATAFLAALGSTAKKVALPPTAAVLDMAAQMLVKMSTNQVQAAHVGKIDIAADKLSELPISTSGAACQLLTASSKLLRDALREFDQAVEDAKSGGGYEFLSETYVGEEDDVDDEQGDDEELFGQNAVVVPTRQLIEAAVDLVDRAIASSAEVGFDEETAELLVTYSEGASAQVDSLVCSLHEEDEAGASRFVSSLFVSVRNLCEVVGGDVRLWESVVRAACGALDPTGLESLHL